MPLELCNVSWVRWRNVVGVVGELCSGCQYPHRHPHQPPQRYPYQYSPRALINVSQPSSIIEIRLGIDGSVICYRLELVNIRSSSSRISASPNNVGSTPSSP